MSRYLCLGNRRRTGERHEYCCEKQKVSLISHCSFSHDWFFLGFGVLQLRRPRQVGFREGYTFTKFLPDLLPESSVKLDFLARLPLFFRRRGGPRAESSFLRLLQRRVSWRSWVWGRRRPSGRHLEGSFGSARCCLRLRRRFRRCVVFRGG